MFKIFLWKGNSVPLVAWIEKSIFYQLDMSKVKTRELHQAKLSLFGDIVDEKID